jgi:curved DNA-binding protein CbpA
MSSLHDEVQRNLAVLDLEPGVSWQQVKDRYRFLAKVWHPDRFGSDGRARARAEKQFKTVNEAYQWLLEHRSTIDSLAENPQPEGTDEESHEQEPEPQPEPRRHRPRPAKQREAEAGGSAVEKFLWGMIATFALIAGVILVASTLPEWINREGLSASTSEPQADVADSNSGSDAVTYSAPASAASPRSQADRSQTPPPTRVIDFATFARANQAAERRPEGAVTDGPTPRAGDDGVGEAELIRGAWKPKNPDPVASRRGTAESANSKADLEHWSGAVDGSPPPDLPRVSIRLFEDVEVGERMGTVVYWHEAGACSYGLHLHEQIGDWIRTEQVPEASECAPLGEIWFFVGETNLTALWHRLDGSQWFSSRLNLD